MKFLISHNKKCGLKFDQKQVGYCFTNEMPYWGNAYGNITKRNNHWWLKMRCNYPECPAIVVIESNEISQLIMDKIFED